jgi:hypothetical protein
LILLIKKNEDRIIVINKMKNAAKPYLSISQPPNIGKSAGRIFPAPAIPVYKVRFSLAEIPEVHHSLK